MSRRTQNAMDELPDLQSDADVDALMARLRARIAPVSPAAEGTAATAASGDALASLVTAHDALAASMVRVIEGIVNALEEFAVEDTGVSVLLKAAPPRRRSRVRRRRNVPARGANRQGRQR